jgi:hypothetical protein
MTFLFRYPLPFKKKLERVSDAATSHAFSLFLHAALYKLTLYLLSLTSRLTLTSNLSLTLSPTLKPFTGSPLRPYHAALAGMAGGYLVWGRSTPVNRQVTLYLLSRVLHAASITIFTPSPHTGKEIDSRYGRFASSVVWGAVMYMFEMGDDGNLQGSLRRSMEEIYRADGSGEEGGDITMRRALSGGGGNVLG